MHNVRITQKNPILITLVVDRSGSMADKIEYEGEIVSRSSCVSRIINLTIDDIILRCKKGASYRNYFEIGVIGYNNDKTYSMLDFISTEKMFFTPQELADADVETKTEYKLLKLPNKKISQYSRKTNCWIDGECGGSTPTHSALHYVYTSTVKWIDKHPESPPPAIIHISNGMATDATPEMIVDIAEKIKGLKTNNGSVLLFNIHVGIHDKSIIFPLSKDETIKNKKHASLLYDISSDMPEYFYEQIARTKGIETIKPNQTVKAMAFNASVSDLITLLNIGTSTIR